MLQVKILNPASKEESAEEYEMRINNFLTEIQKANCVIHRTEFFVSDLRATYYILYDTPNPRTPIRQLHPPQSKHKRKSR